MSSRYRLDEINAMDRRVFITTFGGVFEDSPWVAESAWQSLPFETKEHLVAALSDVVRRAGRERQLVLLRAHPELGARKPLTGHSEREQRDAGLKRGGTGQVQSLVELNRRYRNKFGFPFILAVKGLDPDNILIRFRERLENNPQDEFDECLEQVFRIARFRLEELLGSSADG